MNVKKIILIFILQIFLLSYCFVSYGAGDISTIINEMNPSTSTGDITENNKVIKIINVVFTIIRAVGTGIALIMVLIAGMKYMLASVEAKAEVKKQVITILVGSVLLFATSNILKIVSDLATE